MNIPRFAVIGCTFLAFLPGDAFSMSGKEWYHACSEFLVATPEQRKSATPEKKVEYRACQIEANRAWCDMNFEGDARGVVSGMKESQKKQISQQLEPVCPTLWNMPFGGPFVVIARELEKRGGPSLVEKWLPASKMLQESLLRTWPSCSAERLRLGLAGNAEKCFEAWNKNIE